MWKPWKQWQTFILRLQNHCRWWLQPWNWKTLTPWKESYDQPKQHIKKQRHYLSTKVHLAKYGCESWTIKKAESQRIDAFELWCWTRLLRVPWTARRSNQSILKEIILECSLEGLILKHKLQYLGTWWEVTHWKRPWYWERWKAGEGDDRGWDGWMAPPIRWTWVWVISGNWWWTGRPGVLQSMRSQRVGHGTVIELNWTDSLNLRTVTQFHRKMLAFSWFLEARRDKKVETELYVELRKQSTKDSHGPLDLRLPGVLTPRKTSLSLGGHWNSENWKLSTAAAQHDRVRMHAQSCLALWDPMDCSLLGSSVCGIFQARILEWVAISSSRGSSGPWNRIPVSCISSTGRWILYHCATWEA